MLDESKFYPPKTMSAAERLWWYSRYFDVVQVNSSFYAIPPPETTKLWMARTEPGFLFNVKGYGLLTGHDVDVARLPGRAQGAAACRPAKQAGRAHPESRIWEGGARLGPEGASHGAEPLRDADKLGYVLFQLSPWVTFADEALEHLVWLRRALPHTIVAVEFRSRSWFGERTGETLRFLRDHGLTYVSIDGPRSRASVPSIPALTTETAVFAVWPQRAGFLKQVQGKSPTVAEKYD